MKFRLSANFKPAGDQPKAISQLVSGLKEGKRFQTLLGVTGSGKTFTAANVIAALQMPTLVVAHNKTLAAQLSQEYRQFFPANAVHYFVSYYDYYQPEAYIAPTDTYIEKEAQINEEIDRLRHASTQALLTRSDVIIAASVSCIYGLGSPEEYEKVNLKVQVGEEGNRRDFLRKLVAIHYERTSADLSPGLFRALGGNVEIMPVSERVIYRLEFEGKKIVAITKVDPISLEILGDVSVFYLFPAKHFITSEERLAAALKSIKAELKERLKELEAAGRLLEADRLRRRTNYDLAMIGEVGYCNGIENYSRHFSGKLPGQPPDTLLSYFPRDEAGKPAFLTVIDESHVTVPQIRGMYEGDASRKQTLVEHGFRLPSARDNRPLKFPEFLERVGQVLFTSATPSRYEKQVSERMVEQVIRPTGLPDPRVLVRPVNVKGSYRGEVEDFLSEARATVKAGGRVLATTLTKKMAEDLTEFVKKREFKATYLHSDINTLERIQILSDFRRGVYDCLIGVNLLREGLDLPEVEFIAILDSDREGFLRSETSLIQIIGRAARNAAGRVVLYADKVTESIRRALDETNRRRAKQLAYNKAHDITPRTIRKKVADITEELKSERERAVRELAAIDRTRFGGDIVKIIKEKERQMSEAVKVLNFETAAMLRDEIRELRTPNSKSSKKTTERRAVK
ncbi:MAG: excinuclease ABC subunit UvrB [Candidatus Taylorbacteria bacterium]|nr:excinuclease ABC subunit UvrB [Candidatus Taylorbacteria bacterium]